jgi:mycothiol system anti-sigma-R factor
MTDDEDVLGDGAHAPTTDDDACAAALQRLWSYLDKELTPDDEDELRDHLAGCPPCLAEYSIDVVLKRLVRRSCREEAPAELRVRITQTIARARVDGAGRV